MLKKLLPPALAAAVAFTGGWYLRDGAESDKPAAKSRTLTVTGGPLGVVAPDKANYSETGNPPIAIRPLESLQEILDLIATLKTDGQVGALSMLDMLPRLMATDLVTVRRLLNELNEHPNSGDEIFTAMKGGLMFRWLMLQPEEAIGFSLAHPGMFGEMDEINLVGIAYLAKTRPDSAKALAALMPGETEKQAKEFIDMMHAMSNPASVLTDPAKLAKMDDGAIGRLTAKWMSKEPQAALGWFRNLPPEQQSPKITAGMAAAWFTTDRPAALAWMATLPAEERGAAEGRALGDLHRGVKDAAALEARTAGLPESMRAVVRLNWYGDHRNNAEGALPEAASEVKNLLAATPDADPNSGTNAARRIAQQYGQSEKHAEGAAWVASLPEGPARDTAADQFTRGWADKDPTAASEWITSLPQGPMRDSAAKSLIDEIRADDPESALVWAGSLSDEQQQLRQSKEIYTQWITKDPLKALPALGALPPEQQTRIFSAAGN